MGTPLRILLIEDSEDDAILLLRELRRGGYAPEWRRVDTAAALQAALIGDPWDIITCDWVMPQFSAPAALRLLRDRAGHVPVIIVSGEVGEEVAVSALKAGARDYVSKHRLTRLVPAIERELRECEEHRARERAEESLRETRERLRCYIEHAHDVIFTLDAEGRIGSVNRAATEVLGYAAEEIVGRPFFDFLTAESQVRADEAFALVWRGGSYEHGAEFEVLAKHGRRVILEVRGHAVSEGGRFVESFHIGRDVTARRRAEAERAHLSAALEQAPEPIAITDAQGAVLYLNPAGERLAGVTRQEVYGLPYAVIVGDPSTGPRTLADLVDGDGRWSGSVVYRRADGSHFQIEVTVSPIRDASGRIVSYVGRGRGAGDPDSAGVA